MIWIEQHASKINDCIRRRSPCVSGRTVGTGFVLGSMTRKTFFSCVFLGRTAQQPVRQMAGSFGLHNDHFSVGDNESQCGATRNEIRHGNCSISRSGTSVQSFQVSAPMSIGESARVRNVVDPDGQLLSRFLATEKYGLTRKWGRRRRPRHPRAGSNHFHVQRYDDLPRSWLVVVCLYRSKDGRGWVVRRC